MPTTTMPPAAPTADAPLTAAALSDALTALRARIAEKEARLADVRGEIATARAERDRLHRDDAPASTLAAHRTKLRDLEDEESGVAGAIALLSRDVAPLEQQIAKAEQREASDTLEEAVARGNAAFAAYDAAISAAAAAATDTLFATLDEVVATIRASRRSRGDHSPYSDPYASRVIRGHNGKLLHVAQTIRSYHQGHQFPPA